MSSLSNLNNENILIEKKEKNIKETIAFLKENSKNGYEKFKNNEDTFFKIVMFHYNKFLKLCKSPTRMYEFMTHHLIDIIKGVIILSNENEKDFFDNLEPTLIKKNKDYGNSFDKSVDKFGIIYLAIELDKKINRYINLIETGNTPTYESVKDTLLDIAGYCILGLTYMNENHFDIKEKSKSKLVLDDCDIDFDELYWNNNYESIAISDLLQEYENSVNKIKNFLKIELKKRYKDIKYHNSDDFLLCFNIDFYFFEIDIINDNFRIEYYKEMSVGNSNFDYLKTFEELFKYIDDVISERV